MNSEDLWGELPQVEAIKAPKIILEEQASLLAEKTRGLLTGEVKINSNGERFVINFEILAPTLNDYTFGLFIVIHEIGLYPAKVYYDGKEKYLCESEEEFKTALRELFSSDRTRTVITKLLTHLKGSD